MSRTPSDRSTLPPAAVTCPAVVPGCACPAPMVLSARDHELLEQAARRLGLGQVRLTAGDRAMPLVPIAAGDVVI